MSIGQGRRELDPVRAPPPGLRRRFFPAAFAGTGVAAAATFRAAAQRFLCAAAGGEAGSRPERRSGAARKSDYPKRNCFPESLSLRAARFTATTYSAVCRMIAAHLGQVM